MRGADMVTCLDAFQKLAFSTGIGGAGRLRFGVDYACGLCAILACARSDAYIGTHSRSYRNTRAGTNADANACPDSHSGSNTLARTHRVRDPFAESDFYIHSEPYVYALGDHDGNAHSNRNVDARADRYANFDADPHIGTHFNANTFTYVNLYAHTYAYCNVYAEAHGYCDANTYSHA